MIKLIPFGKENRVSKEQLIRWTGMEEKEFNVALRKLRESYIVLSDSKLGGYWRPSTEKEIQDFIKDCNKRIYENSRATLIAYKELKKEEK